MRVTEEEVIFQLECLSNGIRAGYKKFVIPLWFAEFLVDAGADNLFKPMKKIKKSLTRKG